MFPRKRITMPQVLALFVAFSASSEETRKTCLLTFRVVDLDGAPVPFFVSALTDKQGKDHSSKFEGSTGRVPCEFYDYEVSRRDIDPRFGKLTGRIEALAPEKWMTLVTDPNLIVVGTKAGSLGRALPPDFVARGRVLNARPGAPLWIKIQSAFGMGHVETRTDPDGSFRLYRLVGGRCLLYVMDDDRIEYVESLLVKNWASKEPLIIDLSRPARRDRVMR